MATSYSNEGGMGDRTSIITVYSGPGQMWYQAPGGDNYNPTWLIDGLYNYSPPTLANNVAGNCHRFQFSVDKVISEVTFYFLGTNAWGTWKWQGSSNGTDWSDIGAEFALGGSTTQVDTTLSGNSTGYLYYRLLGVSGSVGWDWKMYEVEFKIDDVSEAEVTEITPPAGSIVITGFAPAISVQPPTLQEIVPPSGEIILTGFSPSVYVGLGRGQGNTCARVVYSSTTPPLAVVGMPKERKGT